MHNNLKVTIPMKEEAVQYAGRKYLVVGDGRYAEELRKAITDEEVKNIKNDLGSVNHFISSADQLNNPFLCKMLKELYA